MKLDSKSADKKLKTVTPERSKSCVNAFTKMLVTTFQLSRTRIDHIFLKQAKERHVPCFKIAKSGWLLLGWLILSQDSCPGLIWHYF